MKEIWRKDGEKMEKREFKSSRDRSGEGTRGRGGDNTRVRR
jgi:hypothetical protein